MVDNPDETYQTFLLYNFGNLRAILVKLKEFINFLKFIIVTILQELNDVCIEVLCLKNDLFVC